MKLAIVGATGLVGSKFLKVLEDRDFFVDELIPVASEKSIGTEVYFKGNPIKVVSMQTALNKKPDIALFSAGSEVSLTYAPQFAEKGTRVIDNSSAWRMNENIKLIVPEVNGSLLNKNDFIIANPNCSTIQMVVALFPLHKKFQIQRIVVSTYQSVTGTGNKAVTQLMNERSGTKGEMIYPYPIDLNVIPHIDVFLENGYTKEEMKMVNETKKIMNLPQIQITATAVRLPVLGGHSESINVTFEHDFDETEVTEILRNAPGVTVIDKPAKNQYPMPLHCEDTDDVYVGRIRKDNDCPKALNLWVVSDNLRKGAATNAIQIAELMRDAAWVS
jgi:aspartate-semialdehyde dehydrogenase